MDYLLEQLGPERFQALAQALLTSEQSRVQCLPVGQPDGGRDAFIPIYLDGRREFIVFQVKYVREPAKLEDPHKWLVDTMAGEIPKVAKLIPSGAREYYLISNVRGTSHPDVGSIDKMNKMLADSISIPFSVWWRDDINRRLESAGAAVKWSYPEILRGSDILQVLLESDLMEHKNRRTSAIKAFLADQFGDDEEVRFKQIELQNDLFSLFVDVPGVVKKGPGGRRRRYVQIQILNSLAPKEASSNPGLYDGDRDHLPVGAATLLLNDDAQQEFPFMVIEGAPGQGKSTLAQFVCQVYRMKLKGSRAFGKLPIEHQPKSTRLPIKVDLTEYAAWLSGHNPFIEGDEPNSVKVRLPKQLEAFIAALISKSSGGAAFAVEDLHAVLRSSHVLLALDGLDEVADIRRRAQVIQEITSATRRLADISPSIQIVVTTRPSAFTGVSEFSSKVFHYCDLVSLSIGLINSYTSKWIAAKRLVPRDAKPIRVSLQSRLKQPHLRDLARNPMQLAILLSVIHSRGASLPDKRTALYEIYVDLFLARESEKSAVVRERRELLIDVHCYLAWMLHAQAEANSELGRIDFDRLMEILHGYLAKESWNPELAQELFVGAQRVVFLVARVEGTFEFEVQPLREYFAGKYLYETSAYSRAGNERSGTMPDRFDALARNPYWFNVTRFFAGFLNKGELPALVDRLDALIDDPDYKFTTYPHFLAATLLSDWVFNQHQRSMRAVVDRVLQAAGLRALAARVEPGSGANQIIFPADAGRRELVERSFETLSSVDFDLTERSRICRLLQYNESRDVLFKEWLAYYSSCEIKYKGRWLSIGYYLGVLQHASEKVLGLEKFEESERREAFKWLQYSKKLPIIEGDPILIGSYVKATVDGMLLTDGHLHSKGIPAIGSLFDVEAYSPIFAGMPEMLTFREAVRHFRGGPVKQKRAPSLSLSPELSPIVRAFEKFQRQTLKDLRNSLDLWTDLVEPVRRIAQLKPGIVRLGILAAFVKTSASLETTDVGLFDEDIELCRRTRAARLRAGNAAWWRKQWRQAETLDQLGFLCAIFALVAGPVTISKLAVDFNAAIGALPDDSIETIATTIERVSAVVGTGRTNNRRSQHEAWLEKVSPTSAVLLSIGAGATIKSKVYFVHLSNTKTHLAFISRFAMSVLLRRLSSSSENTRKIWHDVIELADGYSGERPLIPIRHLPSDVTTTMPSVLAKEVSTRPHMPATLVNIARQVCERAAFEDTEPMLLIAKENNWFEDLD